MVSFLQTDPKKALGKHITEVIENTRMHIVAQTGKAELCDMQKIGQAQRGGHQDTDSQGWSSDRRRRQNAVPRA